jgi:hypothetical protein
VWDVGRHAHDGAWCGADGRAADGERERAFEDHHERVERRRVFGEPLAPVEREEREIAAGGFRQDATRDPLLGGRDERVQRKRFGLAESSES